VLRYPRYSGSLIKCLRAIVPCIPQHTGNCLPLAAPLRPCPMQVFVADDNTRSCFHSLSAPTESLLLILQAPELCLSRIDFLRRNRSEKAATCSTTRPYAPCSMHFRHLHLRYLFPRFSRDVVFCGSSSPFLSRTSRRSTDRVLVDAALVFVDNSASGTQRTSRAHLTRY